MKTRTAWIAVTAAGLAALLPGRTLPAQAPNAAAQATAAQTAELQVGQAAPDFALPDQDGKVHRLSDYKGKFVVLAFYPKDATPG
jgi:cytochrome oxidase Cu insertion factor (SCO1/SenC/PrrC family)